MVGKLVGRWLTRTDRRVIDLHMRAGHQRQQLYQLHGSLVDVRCTSSNCDYSEKNYTDPIVPALAIPQEGPQPEPSKTDHSGVEASSALVRSIFHPGRKDLDISDENVPLPPLEKHQLPMCPQCKDGLLRPGVVWFDEALPQAVLDEVDAYCDFQQRIDLIMVIGTSGQVSSAVYFVKVAKQHGARVAVIDTDRYNVLGRDMRNKDWFFEGDAATVVPELLKPVIGDIGELGKTKFPAVLVT